MFIDHIKNNRIDEAIKLSDSEFVGNTNQIIVTKDSEDRPTKILVKVSKYLKWERINILQDLARIFCFHTDIQEIDLKFLLNNSHAVAVADFVNKEIISFLKNSKEVKMKKRDSKLERLIKHSVVTLETLSS